MLTLKIISPERIAFNGEVENVTVPGEKGEFEVLTDHAALISTLVAGNVAYTVNGEKKTMKIQGGFIELQNNIVNLCVEV